MPDSSTQSYILSWNFRGLNTMAILPGIGIPIIKMIRSWDGVSFIMGIPKPMIQYFLHCNGLWLVLHMSKICNTMNFLYMVFREILFCFKSIPLWTFSFKISSAQCQPFGSYVNVLNYEFIRVLSNNKRFHTQEALLLPNWKKQCILAIAAHSNSHANSMLLSGLAPKFIYFHFIQFWLK